MKLKKTMLGLGVLSSTVFLGACGGGGDMVVPVGTGTATPVPTATSTSTPIPTATNTSTPVPTATNTPAPVMRNYTEYSSGLQTASSVQARTGAFTDFGGGQAQLVLNATPTWTLSTTNNFATFSSFGVPNLRLMASRFESAHLATYCLNSNFAGNLNKIYLSSTLEVVSANTTQARQVLNGKTFHWSSCERTNSIVAPDDHITFNSDGTVTNVYPDGGAPQTEILPVAMINAAFDGGGFFDSESGETINLTLYRFPRQGGGYGYAILDRAVQGGIANYGLNLEN